MTVQAESSFPSYTGSSHRQHPGCSTSCTWASARWHVSEFSLFSAALFHGLRAGRNGWRFRWAAVTLVIAVTYAGLDEWHQSFVLFRHAAPLDLVIDTLGALLAQALVWWYATRKWPFTPPTQVRAGAKKPK